MQKLEIVWVGDSTSDRRRIRFIKKNPAASLYDEFEKNFLNRGKPLEGVGYKIFARSGATTQEFVDNAVTRSAFKGVDDVIRHINRNATPKIIIYSLGHNDGITMQNWRSLILPRHITLLDRLFSETSAFVVLRMPNAWMYVDGHSTRENMNGMTESLYSLYFELGNIYKERCLMVNVQDLLNWKDEQVASKLMSDWTHPNEEGYRAIANVIGHAIATLLDDKEIAI